MTKLHLSCHSTSGKEFTLFSDTANFYSCFHLREDTRNTIYTDKMEFHVLELSKLPTELKEESSDILLWAKFINAERKEVIIMMYPYMTLNDNTEIVHSKMFEDGRLTLPMPKGRGVSRVDECWLDKCSEERLYGRIYQKRKC